MRVGARMYPAVGREFAVATLFYLTTTTPVMAAPSIAAPTASPSTVLVGAQTQIYSEP